MLLHGAYAGKEHNSPCFKATRLTESLQQIDENGDGKWILFGDSAFAMNSYVQRMLKGVMCKTTAGKQFNSVMAGVHVTVENAIGELLTQWGMVGHRQTNKLGSVPLAKHVTVAAFLHNCQGTLYGNQCTGLFGPHLHDSMKYEYCRLYSTYTINLS
jgi:hypothetical protein